LESNPDLIQQEPWQRENASSQRVEKSDVMGVYDMDGGVRNYTSSTESDAGSQGNKKTSNTSSSLRRGSDKKSSGTGRDTGEGENKSTQSFSEVAAQVKENGAKPKKNPSAMKSFHKEESRLFDFADEVSPEMPDLEVSSGNGRPAMGYE
jgi:formylglycine-generating enzyme required for sulfatase activity